MNKSQSILLFGVFFLALSLLILSLPQKTYAGLPFSLGCCIAANGTSECLGCGELGEDCAVPQGQCLNELGGNVFEGGAFCSEGLPGAKCFVGGPSEGCCVSESGACSDGVTVSSCGGDVWFVGTPCSEVLQCQDNTANVPAMSTWGFIALAAVLGIVGFTVIRRKLTA